VTSKTSKSVAMRTNLACFPFVKSLDEKLKLCTVPGLLIIDEGAR